MCVCVGGGGGYVRTKKGCYYMHMADSGRMEGVPYVWEQTSCVPGYIIVKCIGLKPSFELS